MAHRISLFIILLIFLPVLCSAGWIINPYQDFGTGEPPAAGTVSYGSVGTISHEETATSITVTAPTNSTGDLLFAVVSGDVDQAVSGWDGFTQITEQSQSSHRLSVAQIVADGTTSYTFSVPAATELTAFIVRVTKNSGTWNIQDFDSAGATAGAVTCPDMTVDQDNSLVLLFFGNDDPYAILVSPTGMTPIAEYNAADPVAAAWYQTYDTGTVTGKSANSTSGGDMTMIGIVIEAQ